MISRLIIRLDCSEKISFQMSSLFHGALMELLPGEYVEFLHDNNLHPYSQHLEKHDQTWFWVVCALNEKADKVIIQDTLMVTKELFLEKKDIRIILSEKNYQMISDKEMMDRFYEDEKQAYVTLEFNTPTVFKRSGSYFYFPDVFCIYQSLMNKYDASYDELSMIDEQTLDLLTESSSIVRYNIRSTYFYLEGVRIPAFLGRITIKIKGTKTMTNFANMLFEFGTYSGVGAKTSLGMGAFSIIKKDGRGSGDR